MWRVDCNKKIPMAGDNLASATSAVSNVCYAFEPSRGIEPRSPHYK